MPAMAAKVTPSATARSIRRWYGPNATARAAPSEDGRSSAVATRLAVPRGTKASGTGPPTSTWAQARTVPSPPTAMTSSAPASTACLVASPPASADRVSASVIRQPRAAAAAPHLPFSCPGPRLGSGWRTTAAVGIPGTQRSWLLEQLLYLSELRVLRVAQPFEEHHLRGHDLGTVLAGALDGHPLGGRG